MAHTLEQINKMIEEGCAFIGKLTSKSNKTLRFSVQDNDVIEEISLDWVNANDLINLEIDHFYYVVEEIPTKGPTYILSLYYLTGKLAGEYQQKIC